MDITKIVQEIQYVLSPAVMVSSSALLLLGYQNKFSNLASRFRVLNHEKRVLSQKDHRDALEEERLTSLTTQVHNLMLRATYVKNAIVLTYCAILCFTGTSILIFSNIYSPAQLLHFTIAVFLIGLVLVFASSVLMIMETALFYKVISLERKS